MNTCGLCQEMFTTASKWYAHLLVKHLVPEPIRAKLVRHEHTCDLCDDPFSCTKIACMGEESSVCVRCSDYHYGDLADRLLEAREEEARECFEDDET